MNTCSYFLSILLSYKIRNIKISYLLPTGVDVIASYMSLSCMAQPQKNLCG